MSEKNDGGFVHPECVTNNCDGITRRDWLAGLAMQGMMDGFLRHEVDDFSPVELSITAYQIADAMIAEGEK